MGAHYNEIEIEDMAWDGVKGACHYLCPCDDRFEISCKQLANCEDIVTCPGFSLIIRVIYDPVQALFRNARPTKEDSDSRRIP
ncbi:zf-CSL-domain-containing protein [Lactarius sanguifluus]|nr:zf-CSL-domain-containing protein [Lactarius sanguifluus]